MPIKLLVTVLFLSIGLSVTFGVAEGLLARCQRICRLIKILRMSTLLLLGLLLGYSLYSLLPQPLILFNHNLP